MAESQVERLAPPPDFRYVGFAPAPRGESHLAGSLASAGAVGGLLLFAHVGPLIALLSCVIAGGATALSMRLRSGPVRRWGAHGARLGFTPWGVLIEPETERFSREGGDVGPRALRWAALSRVHVEATYGADAGTPSTRMSSVTVDALGERFVGRSPGAVPLDAVLIHLEAYAREQAHTIALDLDGERSGEGPFEPDFEPLLSAAQESLASAPVSQRLGLPTSGYRQTSTRAASGATIALLRGMLVSREAKAVDPRALCAVLATELGARELIPDLAALGQSPHPVLAAVARAVALRLGATLAKVGSVEEVAPFLLPRDLDAIESWSRVPSLDVQSVRSTLP